GASGRTGMGGYSLFFFQAEDGIRAGHVTGVQTCALPILHVRGDLVLHQNHGWASGGWMSDSLVDGNVDSGSQQQWISRNCDWKRSEERRVGKECRYRWSPHH